MSESNYYVATAHERPSHPSLEGVRRADVCVVGGGFTGLSAALHLAEAGYDVVLLEAGRIAGGASGRNGGQIGSGQRVGAVELEVSLGRATSRQLWALAEEAKALLRERVARHAIDCDLRPGNLLGATRRRYLPAMAREIDLLASHYDYPHATLLDRDAVRAMVATDDYVGGMFDADGGHLHPLNLALGMARAAVAAGAELHEGSAVTRIDWSEPATLHTATGEVRADHVLLCCNAYVGELDERLAARIMPIANHVLATEPLGAQRAAGLISNNACVHATRYVVDYYRLSADGRLLFGGGETYSPTPPADPKGFVARYMLRVFPQLADVRIDYAWSGQVGITMSRMPHFGRLGRNGLFAQGFSGHGVALTQLAGKLLAEAVDGQASRFDVFAGLAHRQFPGGTRFRHPLLVLGMLYYSLRDRL